MAQLENRTQREGMRDDEKGAIFVPTLPTQVYARIEWSKVEQRSDARMEAQGLHGFQHFHARESRRASKCLGRCFVIGLRRPTQKQLFYIWHEDDDLAEPLVMHVG